MTSLNNPLQEDEATDLTSVTLAGWQRGINRNLDTAFNLTKAAIPKLRKSNAGRIIFIGSVTGGVMAMANQPVYATAKAALVGLTRSLALDEAKYGITCNVILPGWIATDTQSAHERLQGMKTPLGRNGKPEEIAGLTAFLASELSGYMTGQSLVVDGGNSIAEERA
jgi:3-oxoacyl-[acyl-carrier protein] reductase